MSSSWGRAAQALLTQKESRRLFYFWDILANANRASVQLGTGFTMGQASGLTSSSGDIALVTPTESKLLQNHSLPETRTAILRVGQRMKAEDSADAVARAGTELPLLLRDSGADINFLDMTMIHVEAVVEKLLS